MATSRSGADRRRRSADALAIGQVRGFFKLFSAWVFQALCSEFSHEVLDRLGPQENGFPAWKHFLKRLPKSRREASVGISTDLDAVLTLLSTGNLVEFEWLSPWAHLFGLFPEARALLSFAGLELAEAFRKVKEPCSQEFLDKAVDTYHLDEHTLEPDVADSYPGALYPVCPSPTLQVGRVMVEYWLHGSTPSFSEGHFGPGAVSESLDHIDRAVQGPSWEPVYHSPGYGGPLEFKTREEVRRWEIAEWPSGHTLPDSFPVAPLSRMVAVPKTATKPRLIAAEPAAQSWLQQSLLAILKRRMRRYPYLDITDQQHNQLLCLRGLATIDQSRASDRVADKLVQALFPSDWVDAFELCRTDTVHCLCGSDHVLAKFAGMGAATTFPVETLIFAACALSRAYLEDGGLPVDDRHAIVDWLESQASLDTWGFYGDDAVVPNRFFEAICDEYSRWGFIPNAAKSYSGSDGFRESCGVMAVRSSDPSDDGWWEVSPARFHSWPSGSIKVAQSAPTVEVLNRIRMKIELLSGVAVDCDRTRWTEIPQRSMLFDYSDMKGLLWNPRGFGWWDGVWHLASSRDYQQNWHALYQKLKPGVVYRTTCAKDGEIPPSALYVCLHQIQGQAVRSDHYFLGETGEHVLVRRWVIPTAPTVLREPRPFKVRAMLDTNVQA